MPRPVRHREPGPDTGRSQGGDGQPARAAALRRRDDQHRVARGIDALQQLRRRGRRVCCSTRCCIDGARVRGQRRLVRAGAGAGRSPRRARRLARSGSRSTRGRTRRARGRDRGRRPNGAFGSRMSSDEATAPSGTMPFCVGQRERREAAVPGVARRRVGRRRGRVAVADDRARHAGRGERVAEQAHRSRRRACGCSGRRSRAARGK